MEIRIAILYVLLLSMAIAWMLCPLCIRLARRTGFLDHPGERKVHSTPKPYLGGVAIFVSFNLIVLFHLAIALWAPASGPAFLQPALDLIQTHRKGIVDRLPQLFAFLAGSLLVHLIGLYDDRYGMRPRLKLLGIILAAVILVYWGIKLTAFMETPWITLPLTVFWVVLISNSFNLLDNMDGLSSGVAAICLGFLAYNTYKMGQFFVPLTMVALIGAILGFLRHNFYPSKIFMGDAGSLFIGYAISGLSILSTFYIPGTAPTQAAIATPLIVMAVPLFDTISVIIIRLKHHKPIFVGDKNHFSHRLVALGMSHRNAVLFVYLVTFSTGVSASLLNQLNTTGIVLVGIQVLAVFAIISLLEYVSRHSPARQ